MTHAFMNRRTLLVAFVAVASPSLASAKPQMTVHKSPSCGCCGLWIEHVEKAGYAARAINEDDLTVIKEKAGVSDALQSCHTAFVDGYVVEGHVPAEAIDKLLAERPPIRGLAVPGMPAGSPGMPASKPEAFAVMTIPHAGAPKVFLDYPRGYGRG